MDALIASAARALAAGNALDALNAVALRNDAPALALRGIALAQIGDLARAAVLVRKAARMFGARAPIARARCVVAEAEIALAARDLRWPTRALETARATLEHHGDRANAAHARYLEIRRLVLIGRLQEAEGLLVTTDPARLPAALRATHELIVAGIALRRVRARAARTALARARRAARDAGVDALMAEVDASLDLLAAPAARTIAGGRERLLRLDEVEALRASRALIVDACRRVVRQGRTQVAMTRRPVLFALARALTEGWPQEVPRAVLIARAFGTRHADASLRARLRVEVGRLRAVLRGLADVKATARGFALAPRRANEVVVLAWPVDEAYGDVLALLADGVAWSSSGLALALGASQRTMQRALDALAAQGKARAQGRGRARRWTRAPSPGFTTTLLLPAALPAG